MFKNIKAMLRQQGLRINAERNRFDPGLLFLNSIVLSQWHCLHKGGEYSLEEESGRWRRYGEKREGEEAGQGEV